MLSVSGSGTDGLLLTVSTYDLSSPSRSTVLNDFQTFLAAIVTSRLSDFSYTHPLELDVGCSGMSVNLEEKFSNVRYLCLEYAV